MIVAFAHHNGHLSSTFKKKIHIVWLKPTKHSLTLRSKWLMENNIQNPCLMAGFFGFIGLIVARLKKFHFLTFNF
jgi:hypothetical protein